jgi:hypothetical protein
MLPKKKLVCFIELHKRPDDLLSFIPSGYLHDYSCYCFLNVVSLFFLNDHSHTRDTANMPGTFFLCYIRQADNVHALEAWRILPESVRGIELHKEIVDMLDIEFKNALGPGSASSAIFVKRTKKTLLSILPHLSSLEPVLACDMLNDKDTFQPARGEKRKNNDVRSKSKHASAHEKNRKNNETG